jgi:5-methylcytosine-specific restriction endonuclease McrA
MTSESAIILSTKQKGVAMKIQNKVLATLLLVIFLGATPANAFLPILIIAGEAVVAELSSVAIVSEAVMAGESTTAITTATQSVSMAAARKTFSKVIKGSSNYRKTAIKNTPRKKGGWIQDPYNGKYYRQKDMDVDHIWPKSKGGTNHSWNLIMSSKQTNRAKGNTIDSRVVKGYLENAKQGLKNLLK